MRPRALTFLCVVALLGASHEARAQSTEEGARTTTRAPLEPGEAGSRVGRESMQRRQPRSAPEALVYEPGVFVQQTAHAQGSAFVRGRTGQQTVLLFDGIRLNNALFRQGPNQYFFTIDARTIHHIDVTRGSASTVYGTDAIAGAINAVPMDPTVGERGWAGRATVQGQYASADGLVGGRLQLDASLADQVYVLAGVGYRSAGRLESSGPITGVGNDEVPEVPRFEPDGRTQLGTGFDELTLDVRALIPLSKRARLVAAYYDYRQFDAPRTDQCPPPEAPFDECLTYEEQFRQLGYLRLNAHVNRTLRRTQLTLSVQRQHERRALARPGSFTTNGGRDDVTSWGLDWRSSSVWFEPHPHHKIKWTWGAQLYKDRVSSAAWITFTDNDITRLRSRGQYIEGSSAINAGLWTLGSWRLYETLTLRAGGRAARVALESPADAQSATQAVDAAWSPLVGNVGAEWWVNPWLTLLANLDQGFRAPNLDDLTSRQRTGPGYQIENPALQPERALTSEVGVRVANSWVELDVWGYRSSLSEAITRAPRQASDCPPNTPDCTNARTYLQLVNAPADAIIWGAEGGLKLSLPHRTQVRATLSWAVGSGPNPTDVTLDRVPISRIPPLNGTVEGLWRSANGWYAGTGLRWARAQTRLSLSDVSDARIPRGGTPGFATLDLRAGYSWRDTVRTNLVLENITDTAYRSHGSSVNGPARGIRLNIEGSF